MQDYTETPLYMYTGTNNPLNTILNMFGWVYLHISTVGHGRVVILPHQVEVGMKTAESSPTGVA